MDDFLRFLALAAVVSGGVGVVVFLLLAIGIRSGRIVITDKE